MEAANSPMGFLSAGEVGCFLLIAQDQHRMERRSLQANGPRAWHRVRIVEEHESYPSIDPRRLGIRVRGDGSDERGHARRAAVLPAVTAPIAAERDHLEHGEGGRP